MRDPFQNLLTKRYDINFMLVFAVINVFVTDMSDLIPQFRPGYVSS